MTTFHITVTVDNDAFEGANLGPELGRILNCASKRIGHYDQADLERVLKPGEGPGVLKDLNGNTVGHYFFKP